MEVHRLAASIFGQQLDPTSQFSLFTKNAERATEKVCGASITADGIDSSWPDGAQTMV
jgi:hypothetical protein